MKSTGIVRRVDELGRIVLPKELREVLDIQIKDGLEIFSDGTRVLINKYEKDCVICKSKVELVSFKEKLICKKCIEVIKRV